MKDSQKLRAKRKALEDMDNFYKTILHQELEKWLEHPTYSRQTFSNDDGSSYIIETKDTQFILVKVK